MDALKCSHCVELLAKCCPPPAHGLPLVLLTGNKSCVYFVHPWLDVYDLGPLSVTAVVDRCHNHLKRHNGPSSTYLMMHVNGGFQATRAFRSQVAQPKGGPSLFRRPGRFRQPSPRAAQGFKGKDLPEMSLSLKFQYCFAYTRTDNGFQAPQPLQAAQPKGGPKP